MNRLAIVAAVVATVTGGAYAQQPATSVGSSAQMQTLSNLPQSATTVTNYYKQNVYDPSDAKIGEIYEGANEVQKWIIARKLYGRELTG